MIMWIFGALCGALIATVGCICYAYYLGFKTWEDW